MANLVEYALGYEKLGFFVLPIDPVKKKPLVKWVHRKDQRPTRSEIINWFDKWPNARAGIATGSASGLDAIDLDNPQAITRIEALCGGNQPETISQTTGRGLHLLFKHNGNGLRNIAGKGENKGIDFKTDGGFIVVAPSPHKNGKCYQWTKINPLVDGLDDLLEMPQELIEHFKKQNGCNGERKKITLDPVEQGARNETLARLGHRVESHPEVFKNDKQMVLEVSRSAKSFLVGVTIPTAGTETQREAKFSGKHAPYLFFIVDEGDAVPNEVYRGIESCISGGAVRVLIMFNPRAEGGEVWRLERDGRANIVHLSALNHPNVVTGEDKIPGAVTRETTVRRINEWCRPLAEDEAPGAETFELPEYLEGVVASSHAGNPYQPLMPGHYKIEAPEFYYMVLGK